MKYRWEIHDDNNWPREMNDQYLSVVFAINNFTNCVRVSSYPLETLHPSPLRVHRIREWTSPGQEEGLHAGID